MMPYMGIPVQPRSLETLRFRGGTWLLFRAVSRQSRSSESLRGCKTWPLCDLALDAVIESSVSLTRSSLILLPHSHPQTRTRHSMGGQNHIPQSESSARIAGPSIITCWEFSYHYRSSALPDEQLTIATESFMREVIEKSSVYRPKGQEWIIVEENKCYRVFAEWKDRIKEKSAWQAPLGIVLALSATLATSTFADHSWIKGSTLTAFFLFCLLASTLWLLREAWKGVRAKNTSVDSLLTELKRDSVRQSASIASPAGTASPASSSIP